MCQVEKQKRDSNITTIGNARISFAKLARLQASSVLGRNSNWQFRLQRFSRCVVWDLTVRVCAMGPFRASAVRIFTTSHLVRKLPGRHLQGAPQVAHCVSQ